MKVDEGGLKPVKWELGWSNLKISVASSQVR